MNRKIMTLFSMFVAIITVALRTVTLIYATESATGFFVTRLTTLGIVLSAAVFFIALLDFAFSFTAYDSVCKSIEISKISGIISVLLGVFVVLFGLGSGAHGSIHMWQQFLEKTSAVLCGLWFMAIGVNAFYNLKLPVFFNILPAVHWVCKLIVVFGNFSSNALVAEHIFTLAALAVSCIFMLIFGKSLSNMQGKKAARFLFPIALLGAILNITSALSRIIVTAVGMSEKIHGEVSVDFVTLLAGIFMFALTNDIKNKEKGE